jgi:hypothetical protein
LWLSAGSSCRQHLHTLHFHDRRRSEAARRRSFLDEITDTLADTTIAQASSETFTTLVSADPGILIRGAAFARCSRAGYIGHDDPRLRWHWVHGLSPEINASVNGRLICDHRIENALKRENAALPLFISSQ